MLLVTWKVDSKKAPKGVREFKAFRGRDEHHFTKECDRSEVQVLGKTSSSSSHPAWQA